MHRRSGFSTRTNSSVHDVCITSFSCERKNKRERNGQTPSRTAKWHVWTQAHPPYCSFLRKAGPRTSEKRDDRRLHQLLGCIGGNSAIKVTDSCPPLFPCQPSVVQITALTPRELQTLTAIVYPESGFSAIDRARDNDATGTYPWISLSISHVSDGG